MRSQCSHCHSSTITLLLLLWCICCVSIRIIFLKHKSQRLVSCDYSANASMLVVVVSTCCPSSSVPEIWSFSTVRTEACLPIISTELRETSGGRELNSGQSSSLRALSVSQPGSKKCLIKALMLPLKHWTQLLMDRFQACFLLRRWSKESCVRVRKFTGTQGQNHTSGQLPPEQGCELNHVFKPRSLFLQFSWI